MPSLVEICQVIWVLYRKAHGHDEGKSWFWNPPPPVIHFNQFILKFIWWVRYFRYFSDERGGNLHMWMDPKQS